MKTIIAKGSYIDIGTEIGDKSKDAIYHNISLQNKKVAIEELEEKTIRSMINGFSKTISESTIKMMEGLSEGSNIPFNDILRYNAMQEIISPEGCTSFAAIGNATSNGNPVLLKNRDKPGDSDFEGARYFKNKEINIFNVLKTEDGNTIAGVVSAGSTGIVMGLNEYGVAIASNAGGAIEVSNKTSKEIYAVSGRPQMMREGLECKTAYEAVNLVLKKLTKAPMGSPGMIFFIDSKDIYIIEGSTQHDQFAIKHITDGAISRSNHFEILEQLNNEKYVSAICRKIRARELVEQNYGLIDYAKLKEFSMDHKNGPYDNSICRHSNDQLGAVTVSAAIMEIDKNNPKKSKMSIALGSPCHAWNNEKGHFTFQMDSDIDSIPEDFLNGDAFKNNFAP